MTKMNRRKISVSKSSPLPIDYLKMVEEVFKDHFDLELKEVQKIFPKSSFKAVGEIFSDEILLSISLIHPQKLSSTTIYASTDFDPKGTQNNLIEILLAACVDALSSMMATLLDKDSPKQIESLITQPIVAVENAPLEWKQLNVNEQQIFIRVDKSNPHLEEMTEQWLMNNDPLYQSEIEEEENATKNLFVAGPKKNNGS